METHVGESRPCPGGIEQGLASLAMLALFAGVALGWLRTSGRGHLRMAAH